MKLYIKPQVEIFDVEVCEMVCLSANNYVGNQEQLAKEREEPEIIIDGEAFGTLW